MPRARIELARRFPSPGPSTPKGCDQKTSKSCRNWGKPALGQLFFLPVSLPIPLPAPVRSGFFRTKIFWIYIVISSVSAQSENRTRTPVSQPRILSPVCLPIPPSGQIFEIPSCSSLPIPPSGHEGKMNVSLNIFVFQFCKIPMSCGRIYAMKAGTFWPS